MSELGTRKVRREIMQKLAGLFVWNLPAEIPPEYVEYELLKTGMCGFFYYEGKPQAIRVSFAEVPDAYYIHKNFLYANPVLGSGILTDGENAVIGYNEPLAKWYPTTTNEIINQYAELWSTANESLIIGLKNTRLLFVGTADNQQAVQGFNELISALWDGKPGFAVNSETLISDGLKILPTANIAADYLRQISETREYIINSCLSAFGVHANTVLKRERQLTGEIDLQIERPAFNIYTMLAERKKLAERLTTFFDFPVTVELNPILQTKPENTTQTDYTETAKARKATLNAMYGKAVNGYIDTDSVAPGNVTTDTESSDESPEPAAPESQEPPEEVIETPDESPDVVVNIDNAESVEIMTEEPAKEKEGEENELAKS